MKTGKYEYISVGKKFKKNDKVYTEDGEIFTFIKFSEDICGQGCCAGYEVEENDEFAFWESELTLIENQND